LGAIKPLLNTAIDGINLIIQGYNKVTPGKDFPLIPKIGAASTATGALGNFSMSTGQVLTTPTSTVSTAGVTTGGGGGGGGGIAGVVASAASAANNIVSGSFNAGSFRTAEAATSGATYNINVSGAFDREGTAREIYNVINDSFYRGTGGANNLQLA
jgi:hypothetical protein